MKTTRNLWPFGVLTAFGLFFAGMTTLVVIATTHGESLVSPDYYEQEMKYQGHIDASHRAEKSGATLQFDSAQNQVVIALPPAQLAQKISGSVEFYRPSAPELDRKLDLALKNDGTQTVDVSHFASGLWVARADWTAGDQAYFLEQKIIVGGN